MKKVRLHYNAPVVLTFAFASFACLVLGWATGGWLTQKLFCVYRAPLSDPFTYVRLVGHVLGHGDYAHYIGNMMLFLVVGPPLEEKYGSGKLLRCILVTAVVSGLVQMAFFPETGFTISSAGRSAACTPFIFTSLEQWKHKANRHRRVSVR